MFDRDNKENAVHNAVAKRREALMDSYLLLAMIVAIYSKRPDGLRGDDDEFDTIISGYRVAMMAICGMVANATDSEGDNAIQTVIVKQRMENLMRDFGFSEAMMNKSKSGFVATLIDSAISNLLTLEEKGEVSTMDQDEVSRAIAVEEGSAADFFSHLR